MRLCVIISHDDRGQPVATQAAVQPIVDRMKQICKDETNVTVYDHFDSDARTPNVEPSCGADGWLEDLWLPGSQFENSASLNCREYSFASVIGIGSPIYAFVVKNVKGKNACSLGPLTNYIVFEPGNACAGNTHLAHEVGHACNLLHTSDQTNLMFKACLSAGRDQVSGFQKSIIRGSKYVTYF